MQMPGEASEETITARSRVWWLQVLAVGSLVLFALALALIPEMRSELTAGWELLRSGDREGLLEWARTLGVIAPLATTALMIAQGIAAPIPAVLVTWTNSLLFGWVWGGILSIAAANLAASLCYVLGRAWGEPVARRLAGERAWTKSTSFLDEHGRDAILVARLVPIVPFDPISYLAGIAGMRFRTFFFATLVGQIPAGMAYSWLATQIDDTRKFVFLGLCIFASLVLVGLVARRVLRGRRGSAAPTGEEAKIAGSSGPDIG